MYEAFPHSDYYDSSVLRVPHQPQLVQFFNRDTKFPRSQDTLFRSKVGFHYIPCQGERSYVFVLSSFRSPAAPGKGAWLVPL